MNNGNSNRNATEPMDMMPSMEMAGGLSESLFEILWRRRWIVLLTTLLAIGGGVFYLLKATPLYTSTSRLYVEQMKNPFELDPTGRISRSNNYLYTQAELIRRTETLAAAIKSPAMGRPKVLAEVDNPIAFLRKKLDVVVGKKDEIINVSFTCPDPEEAATIVNTVVDAHITAHNESKRNESAELVAEFRKDKEKAESKLEATLEEMNEMRQNSDILAWGTDEKNNIARRQLEVISGAMTEARLKRIKAQNFYETVQDMAVDPIGLRQYVQAERIQGPYNALVNETDRLNAELNQLERQRLDLLPKFKPDSAQIAALDGEIQRYEQQIAQLEKEFAATQLNVAREQYQAAQAEEKKYEEDFQKAQEAATEMGREFSQYAVLQGKVDQQKAWLDTLNDKISRIDVSPQTGGFNIEIIEAAELPDAPSHPQKARTLGLAMCLGLFAGTGLALLREWKDQRLRSTDEISALLGLPMLGAIPSMSWPKQTVAIRGQKVRISPDSAEAEAFRTVRTGIFFGAPKDEAKTILVTSPAPGEGKSTTASNLAVAIAQAGQKVLIIDADFRRPMQHNIFKIDRTSKGFGPVLAGQADLEEAIIHTGTENLDILPCGSKISNPAEMLNSESCGRVIQELAERYDRVVIDSPPVTPVTDARILATMCDVTVLVVRADVSTRRITAQAYENLASVDARILGVIVNDVPRKGGRYGYYGGYGYHSKDDRNGANGRSKKKQIKKETQKLIAARDAQIQPKVEIQEPKYQSRRQRKQANRLRAGLLPDARPDREKLL